MLHFEVVSHVDMAKWFHLYVYINMRSFIFIQIIDRTDRDKYNAYRKKNQPTKSDSKLERGRTCLFRYSVNKKLNT